MGLKKFDIDPAVVDDNGICEIQTPLAAGNLTMNGILAAGGFYTESTGHARQIAVITAADDSARTLTVTGTDADGRAQTETMTGASLSTTTTEFAKYWKSISSIAIDAASAGAFTVGTVDELCTQTYPLNWRSQVPANCRFDVTGTISVTAQTHSDAIQQTWTDQNAMPWIATEDTDLVTATADAVGSLDVGATAARFVLVSYSSGAEVQVYISEPSCHG